MVTKKRKLTHKPPALNATKAIRDCGGPDATAAICGVTTKAVYAWRGSVPARHHTAIKKHLEAMP